MVLEDVIIVLELDIPEKMANVQDVMGLEDVLIVEDQEDWLQEYGLLNELINILNVDLRLSFFKKYDIISISI